jgi:hypothetical protein
MGGARLHVEAEALAAAAAPKKLPASFHAGGRYRAAPRLTSALLLLLLAACSKSDPLKEPIETVQRAVEARDATDFATALAPGYRDREHPDAAAAADTVRRYLAAYDALKLDVAGLRIVTRGATATASFRAELTGTPRNVAGLERWLPRSATYDFVLQLEKDGSRWKIASAEWEAR